MQNYSGPIPHRLNEGIILEGRDLLIPWGTRIADLAQLGPVTVLERERSVHLTWQDQLCFGGLRCNVSAIRIFAPPNPRAYLLFLDQFHFVSVELGRERDEAEIGSEFRRIFRHLEEGLGVPTWSYPQYEDNLPSIHWEYPGLQVGYSVLAGCRLTVAHEPDGYEELKNEARLIRAREWGRRVNYVAW